MTDEQLSLWADLVEEAYREGFNDGEAQTNRYERGRKHYSVQECWATSDTLEKLL